MVLVVVVSCVCVCVCVCVCLCVCVCVCVCVVCVCVCVCVCECVCVVCVLCVLLPSPLPPPHAVVGATSRGMLMSVLESFIHDPLVEWRQRKSSRRRHAEAAHAADGLPDGAEVANQDAVRIISRINERLQGFYNNGLERAERLRGHRSAAQTSSLPLSIEGQVHRLIKEATSVENLSRMYVGWMAFL